MHEQIQFSEIAKVLKKLLRKKGISYKQIAERLKLSESSIKKLFVSEDCSIQRLAMICDLIDIDIVDLMVGVKGNEPVTFKMSNSQQLFLLENEECFELYWKLVKERKSKDRIQLEMELDIRKLEGMLRQLDKQNLIKVGKDDSLSIPNMRMVLWLDEGPLVEIYKKKWGHRLVDKAASNSKIPNYYFSLCYSKISESTHMEFVQAFKDLEMEYRKRCAREIKLDATNLLDATMVICMTPEGFFD